MTKKNLTQITIVLDRSGSMASVREATISGFNEFVEVTCKFHTGKKPNEHPQVANVSKGTRIAST